MPVCQASVIAHVQVVVSWLVYLIVICILCRGLGSEEEGKSIQVPALEKLMAVSVHHYQILRRFCCLK